MSARAAMTAERVARGQRALEAERCRRDAHYFIFDHGGLKTKDEHDAAEPVKRVPDVPYLRVLLDCYLVSGRLLPPDQARWARANGLPLAFLQALAQRCVLFIEKSRDVYVTNLTCCYVFWRARAVAHQLILMQSKKDLDAAKLVFVKEPNYGRCSFMEDHLPPALRQLAWPQAGSFGNLYFPNGSQIRAIPEGGDIIRSEHPSVIVSDEAAFQPEFGHSYTAAGPAIDGGGQYIAVSSAEPGEFEAIVQPTTVPRQPTSLPGVSYAMVSETLPLLRIHYSADPARRPGTPEGEAWRAQAVQRYPGGRGSARWRKEMEIEYRALGGARAIPDWETWRTTSKIVVAPFDATGYTLYGSYDHGWNNPAAFYVHGVNGDGHKVTLWEFYADRVPLSAIATIIRGETARVPARSEATIEPDRMVFEGQPFGKLQWIVADPSIWCEDQPMKDEPNKSTADLFRHEGVYFEKGERGGDTTILEWLLGHLWADPLTPRYTITTACPWLLWELGEQRFSGYSAQRNLTNNVSERLVDKHNHAWDALKMFLHRFPPAAQRAKPQAAPDTFQWWRKTALRAKRGEPVTTFRRESVR